MRIIKLSKEVFGFDTKDGCIAYFNHVLPWQKNRFNIVGAGSHIAPSRLKPGELLLFSYEGYIIGIAKTEKIILDSNKLKSIAIDLKSGSLRVFGDPPKLQQLEPLLFQQGYTKQIVGSQGWNIIKTEHEHIVIDFLIKHEWEQYFN